MAEKDLPTALRRGQYVARFADCPADLVKAQALRHLCFVEVAGRVARADGLEIDRFDGLCDHVLVEDLQGHVVCCFRVLAFESGAKINMSYSAQCYDLERLSAYAAPLVELSRFCVHPDAKDTDVLRIAWGLLAAFVDGRGAGMLFGCSSFRGTDGAPYAAAFDLLAAGHLAPEAWQAGVKARDIVPFAKIAQPVTDRRVALGQLPSLLKTYLSMGGWVSDHAVIDAQMNTLHVFTALEVANIPPARAAALRSV